MKTVNNLGVIFLIWATFWGCQKNSTGVDEHTTHKIVFESYNPLTGFAKINTLNTDGTEHRVLDSDSARNYQNLIWIKDKKSIAFSTEKIRLGRMSTVLYQWEISTNRTDSIYALDGYALNSLQWNSDRSEFLFHMYNPENPVAQIFRLDMNKQQLISLSPSNTENWSPVWSPDFFKIAYFSSESWAVCVMDRDGSNKQKIGPDFSTYFIGKPVWSKDSKQIILAEHRGYSLPYSIWLYDFKDNQSTRVYSSQYSISNLDFSPTGSQILFQMRSDYFYNPQLYVLDIADSKPNRLTYDTFFSDAAWLTGDNQILLKSRLNGYDNFYTINSDGSNLTQISYFEGLNEIRTWAINP